MFQKINVNLTIIWKILPLRQNVWRQSYAALTWLYLAYHGRLLSRICENILRLLVRSWWHRWVKASALYLRLRKKKGISIVFFFYFRFFKSFFFIMLKLFFLIDQSELIYLKKIKSLEAFTVDSLFCGGETAHSVKLPPPLATTCEQCICICRNFG